MGVLIGAMFVSGMIGLLFGLARRRPVVGFILGFFLGFIGWIIVLMMKPLEAPTTVDGRVTCPHCAERIMPAASVCPHCNRDVTPSALAPAPAGTAEGWMHDPSGRHPDRYWDGGQWTEWVRDKPGGTRSEDPPVPSQA
jgi:hypothetical protein